MTTDNIGHMPTAYQCAMDVLGNGERTQSRLAALIEHYEKATGLQSEPQMAKHLPGWREACTRIAGRRYPDFQPEA